MKNRSIGEIVFDGFNVIFLSVFLVLCLAPVLHVLFSSLSDPGGLARTRGIILWPRGFTFKGYTLVFSNNNILKGYYNTIIYVTAGTTINLVMTSFGAYALSRKNFFWAKYIMIMVVITMFFNGGLIPTYLLIQNLNMINTRWAIIIPSAISVWNLIIMRTSFMYIPESLEESARIDGAHDFTILFRIIIPLSKAVVAVMILFYAVFHWNSWFSAMIYLRQRNLYPLQLILKEILVQGSTQSMSSAAIIDVNELDYYRSLIQYTTIVVATVPILLLYPFLQKHFVKGIMIGSIKG